MFRRRRLENDEVEDLMMGTFLVLTLAAGVNALVLLLEHTNHNLLAVLACISSMMIIIATPEAR